jgi:hypothetical protein
LIERAHLKHACLHALRHGLAANARLLLLACVTTQQGVHAAALAVNRAAEATQTTLQGTIKQMQASLEEKARENR